MAGQINLQPQVLDLLLYAGDGVEFQLNITDAAGAPIDVTCAVEAEIRLQRPDPDPAIAAFAASMVDAYLGKVMLSLTGDQTEALSNHESSVNGKFTGVWDIQWTPSGKEPRTLCQGKVECVIDVTR